MPPSGAAGMPGISAIVICFNEEAHIGPCLESVRWCDEVVVVDSFSTDRTVEIAHPLADPVIQRTWTGFRDQKAFAHAESTREWVLSIDADERVSEQLKAEIRRALQDDGGKYAGYAIPRVVFYLGRWWWRGGWYPEYNVRLFRRDRAVWSGVEPHNKIVVDGTVRRLSNPLYHFTYRDMEDHIARINRYTTISAREMKRNRGRWRLTDAVTRPAVRFFRSYVLKRGFMEGFAGFYVAVSAAVYVFLKYAKLWELEREEKEGVDRKRPQPRP